MSVKVDATDQLVLVFLGNRSREVTFSPLPDECDRIALDGAKGFKDLELKTNSALQKL